MELGNMMFGNSRGEYSIERGCGWEDEIMRLFEAYAPERHHSFRDYGEEFENATFSVFPYYWGDCACGYEERWEKKEAAWAAENKHSEGCYQTELNARCAEYDAASGYTRMRVAAYGGDDSFFAGFETHSEPVLVDGAAVGVSMMMTPRRDAAMEEYRAASAKRDEFKNLLYDELTAKHGLPRVGCAVHCACERDEKYAEFATTDDHDATCPIVKPNFLYKPTGFEINWYKYPLRDSYKNQKIDLSEFREIINACIASLTSATSSRQV